MDVRGRMAIREIGQRLMNERATGADYYYHCAVSWCKETRRQFRSVSRFAPECPLHGIRMEEGKTHAMSAGVAYAALGTYVWHPTLPYLATGTAVAIGSGVLSDSDTRGSCVARSFGWVTEALAWVVHRISGGHREYTHTGVGDVVCALLATGAIGLEGRHIHVGYGAYGQELSVGRAILAVYLALLFGAGLKALRWIRKDRRREALAVVAGVAMAWTGWDSGGIAWAILVGTVAHAAGDGITEHGIPYGKPVTDHVVHLLPKPLRISTGHVAERAFIAPAFIAALVILAAHAVDPSGLAFVAGRLYALA